MKILYAANNNANSKTQLIRFLEHIDKKHKIKIAAYKVSSPKNINIDWTLDCLLLSNLVSLKNTSNQNIEVYLDQVKAYNPDLIVSDMEFFSSFIARLLGIQVWVCSSELMYYALSFKEKYDLNLSNHFSSVAFDDDKGQANKINFINNADRKLIYSHFGDMEQPPLIKNGFEYVRPYHLVGNLSKPCEHQIVACLAYNNKHIINILNNHQDNVIFTEDANETYSNAIFKNVYQEKEYSCNLKNCKLVVSQGLTNYLADAFYNGKFTAIYPDYKNIECLANSLFSQKYGLSKIFSQNEIDLNPYLNKEVYPRYRNGIKYLHEKIEELV